MENPHLNDIELFEYSSGELSAAEQTRAEHHLAACEECHSLLTLAQAGEDVLRAAPQLELPPHVLERTLGSLGRQDVETTSVRPRFSLGRAVSFLAPVAAIAGIAVIVVLVARNGDDDSATSAEPAPAVAAEAAPAADAAPAEEPSTRALEQTESFDAAASPADAVAEPEADEAAGALDAEPAAAPPTEEPAADPTPAGEPAPAPAEDAAPAEPASPTPAPASPVEADPFAEADPPPPTSDKGAEIGSFSGPADEIVALLAEADISAALAADGSVEVADADADRAAELLAGRAAGDVHVRVVLQTAP